jgi:hypothetical protein
MIPKQHQIPYCEAIYRRSVDRFSKIPLCNSQLNTESSKREKAVTLGLRMWVLCVEMTLSKNTFQKCYIVEVKFIGRGI